jgi:hypothetical protein
MDGATGVELPEEDEPLEGDCESPEPQALRSNAARTPANWQAALRRSREEATKLCVAECTKQKSAGRKVFILAEDLSPMTRKRRGGLVDYRERP